MYRVLSILIDVFSELIIPFIILFILQKKFLPDMSKKRKIVVIFMFLYLSAMMSVVGMPGIKHLLIDMNCNFIPLKDIFSSPMGYILNIILFIPLGFFLPILYKKYRNFKEVTRLGFLISLFIEIMQLFSHRATDIDDLITNTFGTIIGYLIFKIFIKNKVDIKKESKYELPIIMGTAFATMFLIRPFITDIIWSFII